MTRTSEPTCYLVGVALLALTLSTYFLAFLDLGVGNVVVALFIAAAKASLIVLYFMHARSGKAATWLVIVAGLLWIGVLFSLTLSDYLTRRPTM
jgi:cytochrome c oxidase subunit 4